MVFFYRNISIKVTEIIGNPIKVFAAYFIIIIFF